VAKRGGGNKGVIYVLLGKGNGRFRAPIFTTLGNASVTGIAAGDLNRDGDADVAIGKYDGKVLVLFGKGNGHFGSPEPLDTGLNGTTMLLAARLDVDKKLDLAVTNGTDNQITVFLHN
jgi:hypothetical protein